jgi:DNA-binding NarL/FixJ family response regulator
MLCRRATGEIEASFFRFATVRTSQQRGTVEAMRPRLLIVDDHAGFRLSASALLEAEGFHVVGSAATGSAAIRKARELQPEAVLLDIQLPDVDGFAVAEELCSWTDPPIVVLTSSREAATYGDAVSGSPARGFLPKATLSGAALLELVE